MSHGKRPQWLRVVVVSLTMTLGAVLFAAPIGEAGGWQEGPTADAIMCDFDGDGAASEYLAIGTTSFLVRQWVDGQGRMHVNASERFDLTEYYSEDALESIFVTGRNHLAVTVDENGPRDGTAMLRVAISDAAGTVAASIFGIARYDDGALRPLHVEIDGPCGMPYEPTQ